MELVVLLAQGGHVDVVQSIEAGGVIHLLWLQDVPPHHKPLGPGQPVLHRQQLRVRSLARHLLRDVRHLLGCLGNPLEVVQDPRAIGQREEGRATVLVHLCGHLQWRVSELVGMRLVGPNVEGFRARPVFSVQDGFDNGRQVGLVGDGQVLRFLGPHVSGELESLENSHKKYIFTRVL